MTVSLGVRLALMPWTLRLMRQAAGQREKIEALKPELESIGRRYASDPARHSREVLALYRREGVSPFHPAGFIGALVQLPILAMMSAAIREGIRTGGRFLWIRDLARPDAALTLAVVALSTLAASFVPAASKDAKAVSLLVPALLTGLFMWKVSAGLGVYWGVSSGVSAVQSWMVHRRRHPR